MTRCIHNPLDYIKSYGMLTDLTSTNPYAIHVTLECPNSATDGSEFCMPHSILHGDTSPDLALRQATYVIKCVNFSAHGLLIEPRLPDGRLVYPKWWRFRHN